MDRNLEQAELFFNQQNYKEAINFYVKHLAKKEDLSIRFKLATCYFNLKDYGNAQKEWLIILEKEPNNGACLYNLALIHYLSEQHDDSIHYLNKLLKVNPHDKDAKELKKKIQNINRGDVPYLTYTLIVLNLAVYFFVEHISGWTISFSTLLKYGFNSNSDFYQIITSMFIHANLLHLAMNILNLLFFGTLLESKIGTPRFAFLYFFSGIFGAGLSSIYGSTGILIGASGAVFGIIGLASILFPLLTMDIFYFIRMPAIVFTSVYTVFFLLIDSGKNILGISHGAHIGGLIVGMVFGFYVNKKRAKEVFSYWIVIFVLLILSVNYLLLSLIMNFTFTQDTFVKCFLFGVSMSIISLLIKHLKNKGYTDVKI